jgi:hypothetical protein
MELFLDILTPTPEIEQRLLKALRDRLNRALRAAATPIRRRLGVLCHDLIAQTPEIVSLMQGDLLGEFGLTNPEQRIQAILTTIEHGVEVVSTPMLIQGSVLRGGLQFFLLRGDLSYVLQLSESTYISSPSQAQIPWLQWLTQAGDKILVLDHHLTTRLSTDQQRRSRTGKALMVRGGTWSVPSWASGTASNNFLTRAFEVADVATKISTIIAEEVGSRL